MSRSRKTGPPLALLTVILLLMEVFAPVTAAAEPVSVAVAAAPLPLTPGQSVDNWVVSPDGARAV